MTEQQQQQQPRGSPSAPREQRLSFNPKAAAVLHLDRELVDKLYQARLKADLARRRHDHVEQVVQTTRFRRLQFHASVGVAHHLCHLFVGFLRNFGGLAAEVADDDVLSLVAQYDAGSEFEAAFFGGCPKMFLDVAALFDQKYSRQSYVGRSYLVRSERDDKGRRTASAICQHMIDSYLQGDFSAPLLSDDEGGFDDYRDLKDKYDLCGDRIRQRSVPNVDEAGPPKEGGKLSAPWNIVGTNYKLLRKSCFDPSVRIVDLYGQRMKSTGP
ncbi:hypothetical protein B0T24DRAFT_602653 [Lasiosphaeria ovina]|uniref:Uncharacterized protein n=1 Tax=Lasiosphaeria ovina TaxID=92902 RepID=A0AAE0TX53_9PEZI|nr:hypothetical protein B0T24DRAFT_602653 [Lasiosphaeria ovina]